MLDPEYLRTVTEPLEEYFYELETAILCDIAERIRLNSGHMTSTAEWQMRQAKQLGLSNEKINSYLSKALKKSQNEISNIITKSAYKAVEFDNAIFKEAFDAGLIESFNENKASLKKFIEEGISLSSNDVKNICNTAARTSQNKLLQYLNSAYVQIQSGAFSADQVVDNVVNRLSRDSLEWIDYSSGAHRRIDSAVRQALRTSVNRTALKCQEANLDEFGCNLVEVTSHLGSRPSHAEWQGKIYWRIEPYKNYQNFEEATGYGKADGLGGVNCRHSFYPYFTGLSTKSFEHYGKTENEELYDLQQQQRYNERKIREWKRRQKIKESAGVDSTREKYKVSEWKARNKALINSDNRLKRNFAREKAYTRSTKTTPVFNEGKTAKKKVFFNERIPGGFKFSETKDNNLLDSYIAIDKRFMEDGKEHLSVNEAKTGKQLFRLFTTNEKGHVAPSEEAIQYIENAKKDSLTVIHNHPGGGTFSIQDIITHLVTDSFKETIVITNDAEIFFFSHAKGVKIKLDTEKDILNFTDYVESVRRSIKSRNKTLSIKEVNHKAWIKVCKEMKWEYGYKKIG